MGEQEQPARQRPKHELAVLTAKEGFLAIMKNPETWMREAAFALQAMSESEYLQKCTPDSIRKAVAGVALTGTTLNPNLKLAYLVPRQDHGTWKACLQFSYRGGIKTVVDGGSIRGVRAVVVFDFDEFDYNMGTPPFIKHKLGNPPDDFEDKPELILKHFSHCFSVATFSDGTEEALVLPRWKILKNMKSSAQFKKAAEKMKKGEKGSGIHDNWLEEMLRKTQFLYHCKSLPISDKAREMLAFAHEADRVEPTQEERGSTAKDLMGRFGFNQGEGAVDVAAECEFCPMEGGQHQSACPNNLPGGEES